MLSGTAFHSHTITSFSYPKDNCLVDVIGNAEVTVTKNAMKVYAKYSMEAGFDYETETQLNEQEINEYVKQAMTELIAKR